jgi:hypothetical protein
MTERFSASALCLYHVPALIIFLTVLCNGLAKGILALNTYLTSYSLNAITANHQGRVQFVYIDYDHAHAIHRNLRRRLRDWSLILLPVSQPHLTKIIFVTLTSRLRVRMGVHSKVSH